MLRDYLCFLGILYLCTCVYVLGPMALPGWRLVGGKDEPLVHNSCPPSHQPRGAAPPPHKPSPNNLLQQT
jgi:hypothetical protein